MGWRNYGSMMRQTKLTLTGIRRGSSGATVPVTQRGGWVGGLFVQDWQRSVPAPVKRSAAPGGAGADRSGKGLPVGHVYSIMAWTDPMGSAKSIRLH